MNHSKNTNAKNERDAEDASFIQEARNVLSVLCAVKGKRMAAAFVSINDEEEASAAMGFLGYDGVKQGKCASDSVFATTVLLDTLCKKIKAVVELIELSEDVAKERGLGLSIRDKFIFDCQKAVEKTGIFELRVKEGDKK